LPVLAGIIVVFLLVQSPIFAETDNSLNNVQEEISGKQNQITELRSEEKALLADLVALESQLQQNQQELGMLQKEISSTQIELIEVQQAYQDKKVELKEKSETLHKRLESIYTESRFVNFEFIFSCKDIASLLSRIDYLGLIADQDSKLVQKISSEKESLEKTEAKIEQDKRELMELEANCKSTKAELDSKIQEKELLINDVRARKLQTEENLQTLMNQATAIRANMDRIQPTSRGTARGSLRMLATGYCPCARCCGKSTGITASGLPAGKGVVAVDPKVIPLGTKLYIAGYGEAIAGDTGGNIVGNRIDLGFDSHSQALSWGKRWVIVDILE